MQTQARSGVGFSKQGCRKRIGVFMDKNIFENNEFHHKFKNAIKAYNSALEEDIDAPQAAQDFLASIFESDMDAAFEYSLVLENLQDEETRRKLQDIVINSASC